MSVPIIQRTAPENPSRAVTTVILPPRRIAMVATMLTEPKPFVPTLAERLVAYWSGTTAAIAIVLVVGNIAQAVSSTF